TIPRMAFEAANLARPTMVQSDASAAATAASLRMRGSACWGKLSQTIRMIATAGTARGGTAAAMMPVATRAAREPSPDRLGCEGERAVTRRERSRLREAALCMRPMVASAADALGPSAFPFLQRAFDAQPPTPETDLDRRLRRLKDRAEEFARLSVGQK